MISEKRLLQAMLRQDLKSFIMKSFHSLHPAINYIDNWHIDMLCNLLQEATQGKIKRLIINIPPRYLKSICCSIVWPAWILGHFPHKKIITCSYSQIISDKNALAHRNLSYEQWYRELFPHFELCADQNTKNKFQTIVHGFRFSTTTGGSLTGEGGDFIIIDDPQNPMLIHCEYYQKYSINWFEQVLLTRLNNKKEGVIILLMHRLHSNDLTGYLLHKYNKNHWHHINLPAYNNKKSIKINNFLYKKNQPLHPARENKKDLQKIKNEIGIYNFETQYQQNPLKKSGQYIDIQKILRYDELPVNDLEICQSWDTSNNDGKNNDWSVCTTWLIHEKKFYLMYIVRKKLKYPALKNLIIDHFQHYNTSKILIENKASGQQIVQELSNKLPIIAINPNKINKLARLMRVIHLFVEEKILLPKKASWLEIFEQELIFFPNSKHDDQIDSVTQFLNYQMDNEILQMRIRKF